MLRFTPGWGDHRRGQQQDGGSVESLTLELDQAIAMAHENNQASAAIAGIQAKAELHGLDVDRREFKDKATPTTTPR